MSAIREYRCNHCGGTFRSTVANECFLCGGQDSLEPLGPIEPLHEQPPPAAARLTSADLAALAVKSGRVFVALKLLAASTFFFALGGVLIFKAEFRDDPNRIGGNDIVRGLSVGVVGLVVVGFGIMHLLALRRKPEKGEATKVARESLGELLK